MKIKAIFTFLISISLFLIALSLLSSLVEPKYASGSREGNLIAEYYRESDSKSLHDVIFVGDCEAYSTFVPPLLWERYGITSFVRGSPSQTIAQSYTLITETLQYETPKAIVLSVYALCREEGAREAYNRITLDGMRPSLHKLRAVFSSIGEEESAISYFVPLLRYHSRWNELSAEDFKYLFKRPQVSHNGYLLKKEIEAPENVECEKGEAPHDLPRENLDYLDRIIKECKKSGVELILVKAPVDSWLYPWYEEWDREINGWAEMNGVKYYDLIIHKGQIGLDMSCDSYDGGLHLNVFGAEKTTLYFGEILQKEHNIAPHHGEKTVSRWKEKLDKYYKERNE